MYKIFISQQKALLKTLRNDSDNNWTIDFSQCHELWTI